MLNDAGKAGEAGDVQRRLTIVSRLAGRPSDDLEAHERCYLRNRPRAAAQYAGEAGKAGDNG